MAPWILLLIIVLSMVGGVSFLISRAVYRQSVKAGSKYAITIHVATFILSFVIILAALGFVLMNNVMLRR